METDGQTGTVKQKEKMSIVQTIHKKGRRLIRQAQGFINPDKATQRLNELQADVEVGNQIEGLFSLPVWISHIEPWLKKELGYLVTQSVEEGKTPLQYAQLRARFHGLKSFGNKLQEFITKKTKALQELETLRSQIEEESRDRRQG